MRKITLAFTGHRPNKLNNEYNGGPMSDNIKARIISGIRKLEEMGFEIQIISGMALGIDMIAAEIAIELGLTWTAAIPFLGQETAWPKESQDRYHRLLSKTTKIVYVSEPGYTPSKMQIRNEWMVDMCDLLIGVWDKSTGGTMNCISYAKSVHKPCIIINPRNTKDVITFNTKQLLGK